MRLNLRQRVIRLATRMLTKPLGHYQHRTPNDLATIRGQIKQGDIMLVEGDQRVSEVIKYLTQSTWSHSAMYIGDELWRRHPTERPALLARFGDDAQHLLVEALVEEGVTVSPLVKYADYNIRVCRPTHIRREDLQVVLDDVIAHLGVRYDVRNLIDLAQYFFPVSLVPRRFRRRVLELGSGLSSKKVMCSSMIAHAFRKVRYPIIPEVTRSDEPLPRTLVERLLGRPHQQASVFRPQPITLISPRDFDLSPYFEIVKFDGFEDYRKICWADDRASAEAVASDQAS